MGMAPGSLVDNKLLAREHSVYRRAPDTNPK